MPAMEVMAKLREQGVIVHSPKCDLASAASLKEALDLCSTFMPPIKGCINAAMVLQVRYMSDLAKALWTKRLQDSIFDNMSLSQWETTIRSKAHSSFNLHKTLPESLDFFIQLASTTGQSNYAAGCTFQDALACLRVARGQKAISLDLGWMSNIGIIAETEEYQRQRRLVANFGQIKDVELLAFLDIYCDPNCPLASVDSSQVLVGLVTPANIVARGLELPPVQAQQPLFDGFSEVSGSVAAHLRVEAASDGAENFEAMFREAAKSSSSEEDLAKVVARALAAKLGRSLSVAPEDIEITKPLSKYGVDSLMAVELRNMLAKEFHANVAVFDIMSETPMLDVARLVVKRSEIGGRKAM